MIDNDHRRNIIIIVAAVGMAVSVACLLVRVYLRLVVYPPFAWDDFILFVAAVVAIAQSSIIFAATSHGLSPNQPYILQPFLLPNHILYLLTIYLSKSTILTSHLRLASSKLHNQVSWCTLCLCTGWVLSAVVILAVNCELNRSGNSRSDLIPRWRYITAMNILTEFILFILAVSLVKNLSIGQMRKIGLLAAFFFRLPMIIFAIFHLHDLRTIHDKSPDTILHDQSISPILWSQVELNYALVACSVFCIGEFMGCRGDCSGFRQGTVSEEGMGHVQGESQDGGEKASEDSQARDLLVDGISPPLSEMVIRKEIEYSVEYGQKQKHVGPPKAAGTENWDLYFHFRNR